MKRNVIYIFLTFLISVGLTGCLSSTKELTVSEKGKTYYASEKECPYYEINKDDTVRCTDRNGKYMKTLKPLKPKEIQVIREAMMINTRNTIHRRQRWNNHMSHVGFYYAADYIDTVDFGY